METEVRLHIIKLIGFCRFIQVYIRDQPLEPSQFFAPGRPCPNICTKEQEGTIHSEHANTNGVRCSRGHHWLYRKTIADVVEALVGAFIVDSGFKAASAFLRWIGIKVDFDASQVINACRASCVYMPLSLSRDVVPLEHDLEYSFHHRGLLLQAFVHPSYNKHGGGCYQVCSFSYLIRRGIYYLFLLSILSVIKAFNVMTILAADTCCGFNRDLSFLGMLFWTT